MKVKDSQLRNAYWTAFSIRKINPLSSFLKYYLCWGKKEESINAHKSKLPKNGHLSDYDP